MRNPLLRIGLVGVLVGVARRLQVAEHGMRWQAGKPVTRQIPSRASSPRAIQKQKTPAKAAVVGTSQGFQKQRLRSESNRRWRICNPVAEPVSPGNGSDSPEVPTKVPTPAPADRDLAQVVEAWSSLPPAVRAGILAMVRASR